jgi:hypothetical protein
MSAIMSPPPLRRERSFLEGRLSGFVLRHKCQKGGDFKVNMGKVTANSPTLNMTPKKKEEKEELVRLTKKLLHQNKYDPVTIIFFCLGKEAANNHLDGLKVCHDRKCLIEDLVAILRRKPRGLTEEENDMLHMKEPKQPWDGIALREFRSHNLQRVRKSAQVNACDLHPSDAEYR